MSTVPFISEQSVAKILTWDLTFRAVETALESVSKDSTVQNARTFTRCSETETLLLSMPGYLNNPQFGVLGCKLLTVSRSNSKLQLPTNNANILLFDEVTGLLKAIVAGTEITSWRTAAASAVATKHLKPGANFQVLAILGAGVQGRIHAIAFRNIFKFKEVRIWNRNKERALQVVEELNKLLGGGFVCFESNEECVKGADVVVTVTHSREPILQLEWLKPGVHVNAVGADVERPRELSDEIYLKTGIFIDSQAGADEELKSLKKLGVEFKGEIGSLISGDLKPPSLGEITVFQSLGMAIEDCAVARVVYDNYSKTG